jgi:hypothetical protein
MSAAMEDAALWYRVDVSDRICEVGPAWDAFAAENGGLPHVSRDAVIGRPLWDFVSDSNTISLYRQVLAHVRRTGTPHVFTLRCDGPSIERLLEMTIEADGTFVLFRTRTLRTRPIEDSPADAAPARPLKLLRICSWCDRVDVGAGRWVPLETAVLALELFQRRDVPALTHAMCDDCHKALADDVCAGDS